MTPLVRLLLPNFVRARGAVPARVFHHARLNLGASPAAAGSKEAADQLERVCAAGSAELQDIIQKTSPAARERLAAELMRTSTPDRMLHHLTGEETRALGVASFAKVFGQDFKREFAAADLDRSGDISRYEWKRYILAQAARQQPGSGQVGDTPDTPGRRQLALFALNSAIPMVVFGCLDNSIMIVGGDVVDDYVGSTFQLSTLACAAIANTFADVFGISVGNSVEALTSKLGLPKASLTEAQSQLPIVKRTGQIAASVGILIGCIMGMFPLLFMTDHSSQELALKAAFERLDVDHTGFLTLDNVEVALAHAGVAYDEEKLKKVLADADTNHDGQVSLKEFMMKIKSLL